MKTRLITARNFYSIFATLLIFAIAGGADAAEKKTVSITNKWGLVQQRLALPINDRAGHDIGAQLRQDSSFSSDPEWDNAMVLIMGQFDLVKGSGPVGATVCERLKAATRFSSNTTAQPSAAVRATNGNPSARAPWKCMAAPVNLPGSKARARSRARAVRREAARLSF